MTTPTIRVSLDHRIGPVRPRTFGSFVEHLGRCVYGGIYEPGHPTADAEGFREDVKELVRELGTTTLRYPGGNFVSSYRWEDGVGPREHRPRRVDLAWHTTETNEIGVNEFAQWCRETGHELMMAVNLGTRGTEEALDLLEYMNHDESSALSDLRRSHGVDKPHGVRMWCLGNEMDGPWQVGHMSADDYGKKAAQAAAAMKMMDSSLELVACGSSGSGMPTFGEWERTVLEHCYDHVDYISCHAYYQERGGDLPTFLGSAMDMDRFIDAVAATIDHVKHRRRSTKTVEISFDEWNIWYLDEHMESGAIREGWPVAPRLLEDVYSVADAVVLGSLLITLLKRSDRVTSASLAQLVNVIAPIMTEPGGAAWRQTTFFPFALTARLAAGDVLAPQITCDDYQNDTHGTVPVLDAVATADPDGVICVFMVNRSTDAAATPRISLPAAAGYAVRESHLVHDADPYAKNTLEDQERVTPRAADVRVDGTTVEVELPPVSWAVVTLVPA